MSTKRKLITKFDIVEVLHLKQTDAAKTLGVSLSTLKSRYYKLFAGKWPNSQERELMLTTSFNRRVEEHILSAVRIPNLLNSREEDEKKIHPDAFKVLQRNSDVR
uniref:RWP-RK domain-containing protein n=1 Tax=Percolomonas cosmopolitus TaxID=63605 RepID=A0A7S1KMD6_9EUKA|mmetsp:Transcript_1456/g.4966  ORF Transcript_1456/g.4966 Transcript_1456/m.4966 type:complete len:105 (+) Transcript_1456:1092-1406(+)|eukprot:CAMPEP_0117442940 /NCGR_PEP_ID=MMETSP0759-20121206/4422_1 /TAXON_ID=63605 /ORGANISM="Percolomonas cosmopolitus, Strain WS" /LENGTH=104 /DNA_ID=CAMNT_0005234867 /DNA_START=1076 /DNA_END=1390 /DNA_ORIENTATION=+